METVFIFSLRVFTQISRYKFELRHGNPFPYNRYTFQMIVFGCFFRCQGVCGAVSKPTVYVFGFSQENMIWVFRALFGHSISIAKDNPQFRRFSRFSSLAVSVCALNFGFSLSTLLCCWVF